MSQDVPVSLYSPQGWKMLPNVNSLLCYSIYSLCQLFERLFFVLISTQSMRFVAFSVRITFPLPLVSGSSCFEIAQASHLYCAISVLLLLSLVIKVLKHLNWFLHLGLFQLIKMLIRGHSLFWVMTNTFVFFRFCYSIPTLSFCFLQQYLKLFTLCSIFYF